MSLICTACMAELDSGLVICCPHCNALVCESCARANAMLCPHCSTSVYPNS